MVEMRWQEYESYSDPDTGEHFLTASTYKRLQYRYRYPLATHLIDSYPPEDWIWSEWKDVEN